MEVLIGSWSCHCQLVWRAGAQQPGHGTGSGRRDPGPGAPPRDAVRRRPQGRRECDGHGTGREADQASARTGRVSTCVGARLRPLQPTIECRRSRRSRSGVRRRGPRVRPRDGAARLPRCERNSSAPLASIVAARRTCSRRPPPWRRGGRRPRQGWPERRPRRRTAARASTGTARSAAPRVRHDHDALRVRVGVRALQRGVGGVGHRGDGDRRRQRGVEVLRDLARAQGDGLLDGRGGLGLTARRRPRAPRARPGRSTWSRSAGGARRAAAARTPRPCRPPGSRWRASPAAAATGAHAARSHRPGPSRRRPRARSRAADHLAVLGIGARRSCSRARARSSARRAPSSPSGAVRT